MNWILKIQKKSIMFKVICIDDEFYYNGELVLDCPKNNGTVYNVITYGKLDIYNFLVLSGYDGNWDADQFAEIGTQIDELELVNELVLVENK